ncbi:LegC family aminotransferase [Litorivicinus sp.]|nr:LegC family aminotransferase [Litorivicinus sp.]MDC1239979.1 LegC family aminotransferase [Litorivicinus sp.]
MSKAFIRFVQQLYETDEFIPLHAPVFVGRERQLLLETIESTFVSSVGAFVDQFENMVAGYTGAKYAIATVNGTAALHLALKVAGVQNDDAVVTQSLTFVATCNAISYCGAIPFFIDVDMDSLGLSPDALLQFFQDDCEIGADRLCRNKISQRIVRACVPMHTFGFPSRLAELKAICDRFNVILVEDAAEGLGSYANGEHVGTCGALGTLSFNGNKIITTGGGGMILTSDPRLAKRVKHLTTTAKIPHRWAFEHDDIGYNYRLPNLNAALGVAQMECLEQIVLGKRRIAAAYQEWGKENDFTFVVEQPDTRSNYWLNCLILSDQKALNDFLVITNDNDVMTRPMWTPMHKLSIYRDCYHGRLSNTEWLCDRVVNVPSSFKCF